MKYLWILAYIFQALPTRALGMMWGAWLIAYWWVQIDFITGRNFIIKKVSKIEIQEKANA